MAVSTCSTNVRRLICIYQYIVFCRSEKQFIGLPKNIDDAKSLGKVLSRYKDTNYAQVLIGYFTTYILYPLNIIFHNQKHRFYFCQYITELVLLKYHWQSYCFLYQFSQLTVIRHSRVHISQYFIRVSLLVSTCSFPRVFGKYSHIVSIAYSDQTMLMLHDQTVHERRQCYICTFYLICFCYVYMRINDLFRQCSALGATICYLLSYLVATKLVQKYLPERAAEWSSQVSKQIYWTSVRRTPAKVFSHLAMILVHLHYSILFKAHLCNAVNTLLLRFLSFCFRFRNTRIIY